MLYQFINTDGEIVGTKATPNWIYLQSNGFFGLCNFDKCEGVAINGEPYHLEGREGLSNLETVSFKEITEEEYSEQLIAEQLEILDIITGESEGVANENQNES